METKIFTDGSSRGNPGPGGWGAIVVWGDKDKRVRELGGSEKLTTNNRMEMTALVEALKFVQGKDTGKITIFTDSEYVKNGLTLWSHAWQKQGWRTKAGTDVLNKDLWQELIGLTRGLFFEIKVIPGHSGIPANEHCDVIATSFADQAPTPLFDGDYRDYNVDLTIAQTFVGAKKSSGTKAYSYISKIDGIVKVHKTWQECEARVKGKTNARFKKALSKEDENNIVKDFQK